ncbi:MAG TPA: heavy metal-binding domain-containing protein [Steroidobacteraceae bacterium]|nr:heavy metal-binding domain-containing protein [Steroidobacteraceae bacterium]
MSAPPLTRRELICALAAGVFARAAHADDPPDEAIAWVCPMHPSYTSTVAGTCPICGMILIKTRPYDTRNYGLRFRTEPAAPAAGQKVTLFFTFLHPATGAVVKDFEVVHTKLFHLFIISRDLTYFAHIHPTMRDDGTWTIETTVPKAGYYEVLCDFMPTGGSGQFLTAPLVTADYGGDLATDGAHLTSDAVMRKSDDSITATLTFDPPQPASGQYVHLNLSLTDAVTGQGITDLQTYLGQFSHMLLMSEDMKCYVHSHPINLIVEQEDAAAPEYIIAPDADLAAIRGGPTVNFDALMPKAGHFRAWMQFQRHNRVCTIPFTFAVAQGSAVPVLV